MLTKITCIIIIFPNEIGMDNPTSITKFFLHSVLRNSFGDNFLLNSLLTSRKYRVKSSTTGRSVPGTWCKRGWYTVLYRSHIILYVCRGNQSRLYSPNIKISVPWLFSFISSFVLSKIKSYFFTFRRVCSVF